MLMKFNSLTNTAPTLYLSVAPNFAGAEIASPYPSYENVKVYVGIDM